MMKKKKEMADIEKELKGEYELIERLQKREVQGENKKENRAVYIAKKKCDNSKCVIKKMSIMSSEVSTERKFSDKIKNISSITLNKTTYKQIETNVFFFSNYYEAGNLWEYYKHNYKDKVFEIETIIHVMKNVILGLKDLFDSNIIHRDIKPENLVIKYYDEESSKEQNLLKSNIIIIDFGSCKFKDGSNFPIKGTTSFFHPGLIEEKYDKYRDRKVLNEHLDLWSLGVMCLKLIGGRLTKENVEEKEKIVDFIKEKYYIPFNDDTKVELVKFIDSLLQVHPEKQIKIDDLLDEPFIKNDPESFTQFKEENVKHIELINNQKYIELNIEGVENGLNYDYNKLLEIGPDFFNKNVNQCFIGLNQNFLFTEPVLIPIIGIKEEKDP